VTDIEIEGDSGLQFTNGSLMPMLEYLEIATYKLLLRSPAKTQTPESTVLNPPFRIHRSESTVPNPQFRTHRSESTVPNTSRYRKPTQLANLTTVRVTCRRQALTGARSQSNTARSGTTGEYLMTSKCESFPGIHLQLCDHQIKPS
jgi:hypothetical protein